MLNIQKHIIVLTTIFLWSCISVLAGEVREFHFLRDSYASSERTVKSSGENSAMFVNAEFAGGMTNTAKFSLYVSPYLVANQGGRYTKHIYIGSQRIVSKLGDLKSYGADPRRIEYAGSESDGPKVDYKTKYAQQQQAIKDNFSHFDVPYNGADNNDYVDGKGFSERDGSLKSAMLKAAMAKEGNKSASLKDNFQQGDSYEQYQYFYHPDHLGSSSFITNTEGEVVQHIEYVPYGEVFIEERNNVWNTPYLFNAKEFDEETGLYYYGARYYDSRLSMWYGVDALAEKYPSMGGYVYCAGNPVKFVDPDGNKIVFGVNTTIEQQSLYNKTISAAQSSPLFSKLYSKLEQSSIEYTIVFGATIKSTNGIVDAQFNPENKSIIINENLSTIKEGAITEELFHALQFENNEDCNREFEAKVFVYASEFAKSKTASGMNDFYDYLENNMFDDTEGRVLTPSIVNSEEFIQKYKSAEKSYAEYNKKNKIGNVHYWKQSNKVPNLLIKIVNETYE